MPREVNLWLAMQALGKHALKRSRAPKRDGGGCADNQFLGKPEDVPAAEGVRSRWKLRVRAKLWWTSALARNNQSIHKKKVTPHFL